MGDVRFADRHEAGRHLGAVLVDFAPVDPVVVALPRGGVPVAFEVAAMLGCPLDVLIVGKLGLPGQKELAMGAIGEFGVVIQNHEVINAGRVTNDVFSASVELAVRELDTKLKAYRGGASPEELVGKTVIIVDDGIATGSTALAAVEVAKKRGARWMWLAVPVAPRETTEALGAAVDRVVVLEQPRRFLAVGAWYRDFTQTSDSEVRDLLDRSRDR